MEQNLMGKKTDNEKTDNEKTDNEKTDNKNPATFSNELKEYKPLKNEFSTLNDLPKEVLASVFLYLLYYKKDLLTLREVSKHFLDVHDNYLVENLSKESGMEVPSRFTVAKLTLEKVMPAVFKMLTKGKKLDLSSLCDQAKTQLNLLRFYQKNKNLVENSVFKVNDFSFENGTETCDQRFSQLMDKVKEEADKKEYFSLTFERYLSLEKLKSYKTGVAGGLGVNDFSSTEKRVVEKKSYDLLTCDTFVELLKANNLVCVELKNANLKDVKELLGLLNKNTKVKLSGRGKEKDKVLDFLKEQKTVKNLKDNSKKQSKGTVSCSHL